MLVTDVSDWKSPKMLPDTKIALQKTSHGLHSVVAQRSTPAVRASPHSNSQGARGAIG